MCTEKWPATFERSTSMSAITSKQGRRWPCWKCRNCRRNLAERRPVCVPHRNKSGARKAMCSVRNRLTQPRIPRTTRLKQAADSRAGLVAQQEVDDAEAKDLGSEGQLASAEAELSSAKQQMEVSEANQKQYAALSGYTQITAPFAGGLPIVLLILERWLLREHRRARRLLPWCGSRRFRASTGLPIPEFVAAQVHLGDLVNVRVQALDREIQGKVARFADSLDMQTRTMQTEIDVDNRDGRLMPGMYTETKLSLREKKNVLTVPLEAVSRNGDEATVLALGSQNKIEERHVRLGAEDNQRIEVISGLSENERVIIGNRSQFRAGQIVQPKEVAAALTKMGSEN